MLEVRCRLATVDDISELERMREPDVEVGPADARMARYLLGEHHPRDALEERVIVLAEIEVEIEVESAAESAAEIRAEVPAKRRFQPIGYAGAHQTRRYGCDGELQYMYVAPGYRRIGVATRLLECVAEWCAERAMRRVCVDVVPENERARAFYARSGAEPLNPSWMVWSDLPDACGMTGPDPE